MSNLDNTGEDCLRKSLTRFYYEELSENELLNN